MNLIKCGSEVRTKMGKVTAMITAVNIRFDKVQYELSFFVNDKIETIWMNENEFIIDSEQTNKV